MTALILLTILSTAPTQHQPFVRIETSAGVPFSGTIMQYAGDATFVITCAHGLKKRGEEVTVTINRTKQLVGYVESLDQDRDLAVVRCRGFGPVRIYPLADECPASGTAVRTGFEHGQYVQRRGEIRGSREGYRIFEAAGRNGDSGAGIVCDGKLVGVHVRGPADGHGGWSLFVPAETVNEFLSEYPPVEDEKVRGR
ncbi:MAG TPA: trypsin-like peptidase domain-containing protein [Bryobacteraceae bacterium]|nr:trypsin-like peptidase domain-containing protein [Bryobacteraceae bacterium]